jgi:plastocyanin
MLIGVYALAYLMSGLMGAWVITGAQRLPWFSHVGYVSAADPMVMKMEGTGLEIRIQNLDFKSKAGKSVTNQTLITLAGTEVRWINIDPLMTPNGDEGLMPHMIKITDSNKGEMALTASPILTREHNRFAYTFSADGTYTYSCLIHPSLKGKVRVIDLEGKVGVTNHGT